MPSTASQLERSLRRLQISESQEMSTAVQWVPSKYSSDVSQYVLVRPPRAPCGNRWLFGFPIIKKELWHLGTIAFHHIQPDKTLPDNHFYLAMNSLAFLEASLGLRVCTMAYGKVVGNSKNIPSELLWRDTEPEATCPTSSQVRSLEDKLKRPPGWWVEVPTKNDTSILWTNTESKTICRLMAPKGSDTEILCFSIVDSNYADHGNSISRLDQLFPSVRVTTDVCILACPALDNL
ncbi:hypothetical protein BD769DRAFT_1396859 [Suillus cothurnatus]|nr:hypothetical protein BD769DRAFT_1396859 [Suillus cothurnatus]